MSDLHTLEHHEIDNFNIKPALLFVHCVIPNVNFTQLFKKIQM